MRSGRCGRPWGHSRVPRPRSSRAVYDQYNHRVRALIAIGQAVLDRGLDSPVKRQELDEWEPFREP